MRLPELDISLFQRRREKLKEIMPEGSALILVAHPEYIRNNDVEHSYRQDSNLYYLTGFEEPESVLVFRPGKTPETVMYVRPKDLKKETWTGFRYGTHAAKELFKFDETIEIKEFSKTAPDLLNECHTVFYQMYQRPNFDPIFDQMMNQIKSLRGRSSEGYLCVHDSYELLSELRLFKCEYELRMMQKAAEISAQAHIQLIKATAPNVNEMALAGLFIKEIMQRGAPREAYGSIVAGGNNATTLHYVFNNQILMDGELLLVDAGAEFNYYAGDITRTYPVNGKFNPTQKRIYQKVLDVQKTIIELIIPGLEFKSLQDKTIDLLTEIMIDVKLLKGKKEDLISSQAFKKYYPHGVSHWLGSDVHDAGKTKVNGEPRKLEAHMTFTVEPGLYISKYDDEAPEELRGLGIRIEDNIAVTRTGYLNMSSSAPKEPDVLEELVGSDMSVWG